MAHRHRAPTLARALPRSFILDSPKAPIPKRVKAPARKKPFLSSDFERRMASNPYAFMTRLIVAAPPLNANNDNPWIVPDRILSYDLSPPRAGTAMWAFSGPTILNSVAKEGKYKIMNPLAYMRPDMAELVYAQWTIHTANHFLDIVENTNTLKPILVPVLQKEVISEPPEDSSGTVGRIKLELPESKRLQCILCFNGRGHNPVDAADDNGTSGINLSSPEAQSTVPVEGAAALSTASLPTFLSRKRVQGEAWIQWRERSYGSIPVYNLDLLFQNHPQGLDAIRRACTKYVDISHQEGTAPIRIGVMLSPRTVALAANLWKLASMHPPPSP
ncbi:hypothetical protein BGZ83_006100 [Gryganskiella cystojenkinii]|nr:hypothetical protein BGZ83_006100 [Gryganskiella cystojenkinii]